MEIIRRSRRDLTTELRLSDTSGESETLLLDPSEESVVANKVRSDIDSNRRSGKNVRFCPTATIRVVPKWLKKEHPNIWLSPEETSEIRKECVFTIKCMSLDNMHFFLENDSNHCGRGLENKTKAGEKLRYLAKAQAREAVFDEQWNQWYGGIHDDEAIADKYSTLTRSSARLARFWGLKDEQGVRAMR